MADLDGNGGTGNGVERWRGRVEARLDSMHEAVIDLRTWKDEHTSAAKEIEGRIWERIGTMSEQFNARLSRVEARVAVWAAFGSAGGVLLTLLVEWALRKV